MEFFIFLEPLFNYILIFVMGCSALIFMRMFHRNRMMAGLFQIKKEAKQIHLREKSGVNFEFRYFKELKKKVNAYYFFEGNKQKAKRMYALILCAEIFLLLIFVYLKQWILALAFPLLLHWFALKALELKSVTMHEYIQKELPLAIRHMIKVMTRVKDVKTVIFETSKNLNEPLRSKFFDLSRRMITENYEKCLMEFADELDDTWIYAFTFLLQNYKEQSRKADIIKNLALLSDMLEKENYLKEQGLTDKKSVILLNYILAGISVVAFVANLAFNSYAYNFFFNSPGGTISLLIGFVAVLFTLLLNFFLTKNPGQNG